MNRPPPGDRVSVSAKVPRLWNDETEFKLTSDASGNNDAACVDISDGVAYVSGSVNDNGYETACYWTCILRDSASGTSVGRDLISLPDTGAGDAKAHAVRVDGNTVYLPGYQSDSVKSACYWVDAEDSAPVQHILPLPDGASGDSEAYAVFTRNGVVYLAGYYTDASGDKVACYWTDSSASAVRLIVSDYDSEAFSVFVDESGTVYTAGHRSTGEAETDAIACYWVGPGDRSVDLSTSASDAKGILVEDGLIYLAGSDYATADSLTRACYWTDSVLDDGEGPVRALLDSGATTSYAFSLCRTDSTLYVAGFYISGGGTTVAAYWTDSLSDDSEAPERVQLSDGSTDAAAWSVSVGYVKTSQDE